LSVPERRRAPPPGSGYRENVYLSKTDMVTAAIRELIMNGDLRPGDALRQRDLAERFAGSPTPIREALRRLETEGLVSENAHRGSSVVEVDYGATQENFRIGSVRGRWRLSSQRNA
jgi:DNA-binding GntR family transcriptional regulator